ncbi:RxLR effector protein [Phytophthora megakarya]|uniref:RxLR effector protein n=1 Tax=Phytophthora megakarya TaxID=4795 RepID=A0A225VS09_9STRA|nr:RxLR effector protein [Phytophthora megakarya]
MLKLDQSDSKLFESPSFSQWAAFVAVRSKSDPDTTMFTTLAKYYKDDILAKILATAKEVDSTKAIATTMEGLQIKKWVTAGNTADDVFNALKLNQAGDKLFESPLFSTWATFVAQRNNKNPGVEMFTTFTRHYSDDVLAKIIPTHILATAKKFDNTRAKATTLEGLQIMNWVNSKKSADDVFKILKLEQTGDKLFESPLFSIWATFVAKQNSKDPGVEMFTVFASHYTDDALAKIIPTHILATAKTIDSTKAMATKLEGLQIMNWINAKNSADDVFKMLKLDQAGDKLFESPPFITWATFVAKQNSKDPGVEMFSTFTKHYSDDALAKIMPAHILARAKTIGSTRAMATKLEGLQQIPSWISAEKSADDVFKLLKLDQTGDKLFESPLLSVWTTFVAKINRENPDEVVIKQLVDTFDDVPLARMISVATKVDTTKDLAGQLRTAQFNQWRSKRKTPQEVNTMLSVLTNTDDVTKRISRDYEKFYVKKAPVGRSETSMEEQAEDATRSQHNVDRKLLFTKDQFVFLANWTIFRMKIS